MYSGVQPGEVDSDARRTLRAVQIEALAARADYAKALAAFRASVDSAERLAGLANLELRR